MDDDDDDLYDGTREEVDDPACGWLPTATPVRDGPGWCVYTLLPRTTFDWGSIESEGRVTYELGLPLDLVATPELMLVVRVHAAAFTTNRATFVLESVSRSDEDPGVAFFSSLPLASVVIDASAIGGSSRIERARCDVAPFVRARLHLDQDARNDGSMTLSAELVARTTQSGDCRCPTAR
jgi:hypothetical protein